MFDTMFARDVQQTLEHFRRSVDQLFHNFDSAQLASAGEQSQTDPASEIAFSPAIESGWGNSDLHLRCILPGIRQQDVTVNVVGNQLRIEGERKAPEHWTKGASSPRLAYGRFQTALTLPHGLDLDKVSCRLQDGVLDIAIPVAEQMKPRQVRIETGGSQKTISA